MPTQEYVVPKSIPIIGHSYFYSSAADTTVSKKMIDNVNFKVVVDIYF